MANTLSVPIRNINGRWTSAVIPVGAVDRDVEVQLTSDAWPDAPNGTMFRVDLEHSFDNGQTWAHWVGIGVEVGARCPMTHRLPFFGIEIRGARRCRVVVQTDGPLHLGADVTVL